MKVKVVQNETTATVRRNAHSVIWFDAAFLDWETSSAGKAKTNLTLHVTLTKDDKKILDKDYSTQFDTGHMAHNDGDLYVASDNCVNDMTESLSQATRTLAEQIAFESAVTIDLDRKGQLSPIE
jgi:calcineurin-like phosphoesterase